MECAQAAYDAIVESQGNMTDKPDSKKRRLAKACATCFRTFDAFHWKYSCHTCTRVVCRKCTVKVAWSKRVCWKCVVGVPSVMPSYMRDECPVMDKTEGSTCFLPPPESTATPTTTHFSSEYTYTDMLLPSCRSRGESSVDSFLEDGGLRVSAKLSDDDHDLSRYSTKLSSRAAESQSLDFDWVHPFPKAPRPANEASRLDCVRRLDFETHISFLQKDPFFANQVKNAMDIADATIGSIHLVAESVVFNLGSTGYSSVFEVDEVALREEATCAYGLLQTTPLVVLDTSNDVRFRAHPLAVEHNASSYIVIPILVSGVNLHKECIGTIDLAHHTPLSGPLSPLQIKALQAIANAVGIYVERRCADFNHVQESNRGRRQTAPIGTIEEENVTDSMRSSAAKKRETLNSIWERAMQTSLYMRATISGNGPTTSSRGYIPTMASSRGF
ncbi:unnamed protein product [Aphanomyces euteiches]|uniref:GAF domain-containing protein n=1 Tax=Aphanomyces euteiches TaxID=100861 RepID=A0A6G0XWJ1_9STRA|nr:hypothetical protein Ae201684_001210 [Aphanomyces euteiches]KAH9099874.1 hypothetical protein Ae201684P_018882 [Aphanomyces euteiches]KAH9154760.1 hypothetical protein AeRB84_003183 [Aphanomyces euteiches]